MILLLDTSTKHLAIGLADEHGLLVHQFHAEAGENERGIHDARLALETEKLLQNANTSSQEISRIGIVIGPGSFTGLRIGLSFAKGLAFACHATIIPLTVHELMLAEREGPFYGTIIVPGYREDLYYIADSNNPKEIRTVNGEGLKQIANRPALLHNSFRLQNLSYRINAERYTSPSLFALARLTAESTALLENFDSLEPLYLT